MKLSNILYFDDEDGKFIAEKFFIDGNEVSEEGFEEMLDELDEANCVDDDDSDEEIEICDCPCCESNSYLQVITDTINDVMEMFEDENTCDCCKFNALMGLVFLGADGVLQGCIGRKEDLN